MSALNRFKAQWIRKQYVDAHGEWNPDRDEYGTSYHSTQESALTAAITEGKSAGQCEWFMVSEQKYIGYEWVDQRRWTGDWDGYADLTFDYLRNCDDRGPGNHCS